MIGSNGLNATRPHILMYVLWTFLIGLMFSVAGGFCITAVPAIAIYALVLMIGYRDVFGLQSPELWAPVGLGSRVLRASQPCGAACLHPDRCRPPDVEATWCVGRVSLEEALRAIDFALAGAEAAPAPIRTVS